MFRRQPDLEDQCLSMFWADAAMMSQPMAKAPIPNGFITATHSKEATTSAYVGTQYNKIPAMKNAGALRAPIAPTFMKVAQVSVAIPCMN